MVKRVTATSLIVVIFALLIQVQIFGTVNFSDIKTTDWFYENVDILVNDSRAIIKGYPDGSFMPLTKLTKDQFITMCVRAAGYNLENGKAYWAENNIEKAYDLEFIYRGEFIDFTTQISREEMSLIISRVLEVIDGTQNYSDLEKVSDVILDSTEFTNRFEAPIQLTYKLGIITGYPNHTFKPKGVLTRSEASAVIVRVIDKSERIAFDYDQLMGEIKEADKIVIKDHLLGGKDWLDPTKVTLRENIDIDNSIIQSDMICSPNDLVLEWGMEDTRSIDAKSGSIEYDKYGSREGHREDFENLLLRRVSQTEAAKVMLYLNNKKTIHDLLDHKETFFVLNESNYIIRLNSVTTRDNIAPIVEFNLWYRSDFFVFNHEVDVLHHMPYEDVKIFE
jgi:hypothetical protein